MGVGPSDVSVVVEYWLSSILPAPFLFYTDDKDFMPRARATVEPAGIRHHESEASFQS